MKERQKCIDCAKRSPETETNYTLISAQFGWRLTRMRTPTGDITVEWRCPECWRAHKVARGDVSPASPASERLRPSSPPGPALAASVKRRSAPPSGGSGGGTR